MRDSSLSSGRCVPASGSILAAGQEAADSSLVDEAPEQATCNWSQNIEPPFMAARTRESNVTETRQISEQPGAKVTRRIDGHHRERRANADESHHRETYKERC